MPHDTVEDHPAFAKRNSVFDIGSSSLVLTMPPIIRVQDVSYRYQSQGREPVTALDGISLTVEPGEYVVVLGHNGSGKSTLAKHLNGLLLPVEGDVFVREWNTRTRANLRDIRSTVGMVFQTPDNQIVATIVEEDVAFGPENLGVSHAEIVRRVDWSLEQVGMNPFRHRAPHMLSGGQKQRICIAGMLAMEPDVLVLDEATAMLDPLGRQEVLDVVGRLHRERGTTIVAITHFMSEAVHADRLVIMDAGAIALEGTPREVFRQVDRLRDLHMDTPQVTRMAAMLHARMPEIPAECLTVDELVDAAVGRVLRYTGTPGALPASSSSPAPEVAAEAVIELRDVGHKYMRGTPLEVQAVQHVDLAVRRGEVLGIIGHTGSGKSTIVQHFNALLQADEGEVTIFETTVDAAGGYGALDKRAVRRRVGLVFQRPEAQLFERYVGDDVAYGPRNLGLTREEVRARVRTAMEAVGLGFDAFKDRMTFGLSGGQMRRVALAGVLALEPEVLVLDEPTAGLDPQGRRLLLDLILNLRHQGVTLVIISHNMEELAEICDRLYVIADGTTVMAGHPAEIFAQPDALRARGLDVPPAAEVVRRLVDAGVIPADHPPVYSLAGAAALFEQLVAESA